MYHYRLHYTCSLPTILYNRHYCYRIDFEDGFVYFGVRTCRCPIASDGYMGSPATHAAKWLTDIPRVKTIVSVHATRELAEIAEDNLILAFWAVSKPLSLNASMRGARFNTLGVKISEETRAKMSKPKSAEHRARIGAALTGVERTDETRAKVSQARKGSKWYTDGATGITLKPGDAVPDGFRQGRPKLSAEVCASRSAAQKGKKWYTDGATSIQLKPGNAVPEGFRPGRVMQPRNKA